MLLRCGYTGHSWCTHDGLERQTDQLDSTVIGRGTAEMVLQHPYRQGRYRLVAARLPFACPDVTLRVVRATGLAVPLPVIVRGLHHCDDAPMTIAKGRSGCELDNACAYGIWAVDTRSQLRQLYELFWASLIERGHSEAYILWAIDAIQLLVGAGSAQASHGVGHEVAGYAIIASWWNIALSGECLALSSSPLSAQTAHITVSSDMYHGAISPGG